MVERLRRGIIVGVLAALIAMPGGAALRARQGPPRQGRSQFLRLQRRRGRDRGQDFRAGRPRDRGDGVSRRCAAPAGAHRRQPRCRSRLGTGPGLPRQGRAVGRRRRDVRGAGESRARAALRHAGQDRRRSQGQAHRRDHGGLAHRLAGARAVAPARLGQRRHQDHGARPDAGAARRDPARRARRHGDRGGDRLRAGGGGQGQEFHAVRRHRQGFLHPRHLLDRRRRRQPSRTAAAFPARLVQDRGLHEGQQGFRGEGLGQGGRREAQRRRQDLRRADGGLLARWRLGSRWRST